MRDATARRLRCPRTGMALALEIAAHDGDDVLYGVLTSAAGSYPVIDGIPYFLDGAEPLVDLVRRGRHDQARSLAIARSLPPTRARRAQTALATLGAAGRLEHLMGRVLDRREVRAVGGVTAPGGPGDPLRLLRYGHQERAGGAPDAFDYFAYRYSMPRHLVALGALHGGVPSRGAVLDLGCGAGHLAWSLGEQPEDLDVLGVDPAFFQLWVARHQLRPRADLVCADAARLPFGADTFDAVLASDVLSFVVDKRTIVGEAARVVRPSGLLAFTALKNAHAHHAYAGIPLPADAWRALATGLDHRLLPDGAVLANYLAGSSAPADHAFGAPALAASRTFTLIATKSGDLPAERRFDGWPHGFGPLAVNPLFTRTATVPGGGRYRRRFPSAFYLADNREMADYLPEEVTIPDERLDATTAEGASLVGSLAVLGLPEAYASARWAS